MKSIIKYVEYFGRKASASRLSAYSAQTAFFMFFSLIPLVMLLFSLLNQIGSPTEDLSSAAELYAPDVLSEFFELYYDEIFTDSKLSLTIVSAIALLWSASKGVYAIIGGFNSVYEIKEGRNFILIRLIAMFYTVAFLVIMIAALLLMVFGNFIGNYLYAIFNELKGLVYIISSFRFIIGFVFLVLFFTLVYKTVPGGKLKFSDQIPGAVMASAGWVSFSILFSFFVNNFSNYANIYGSLTAIIVLMLWLYICMYIMFLGAEVNFILSSKVNKEEKTPAE
ncbi:MAG: YihY/virulence factor BrkB family protein [Clostridia bacterium]|nr:YihY/virulence factor BrkB family protein [Clostridia bacterium]